MNNLYGSKYIEKQRRSGYKSTIYAMAEIVDNSVDAKASRIDLIFVEEEKTRGARKTMGISDIYFIDNGLGMKKSRINSCLTFSEGDGITDSRIGAFGVGLPNSSISVGRRVEVYSKDENDEWNFVFLDLDDQIKRDEPGYDEAIIKKPLFDTKLNIPEDARTIIKWSKLDIIDAAYSSTIMERGKLLLGRIYRYAIQDGLEIFVSSMIKGNTKPKQNLEKIIPYDPLFVMSEKNFITSHIWHWAHNEDARGKTPELGDDPEFNSMYHYKKFIEGCKKDQTTLPIFQKFDEYWDVVKTSIIGGIEYKWKIKASFANKSISNPGIRSGGGTEIGKLIGQKMNGTPHFKSGNVFFIRANREIDFGNFGLYTVTDEKNRFWTIEIHFNSDLDQLMGVSNNKQSVDFVAVKNSEIDFIDNDEDIPEGAKRQILYSEITETVIRCIREMRASLTDYAREFKVLEQSKLGDSDQTTTAVPQAESAVIEVIPKGEPWSDDAKSEIGDFLKSKYMHLNKETILQQIEIFAKGLTRTIVLYSPNETGNLFEITEKKGKLITLINTKHIYYINVIEPLKNNRQLKVFAIALEMLISSCAYEMDKLIIDDRNKHEQTLNLYLQQLSSRLNLFITDSHIKVVPEEWEKKLIEDSDSTE